MPVASVNTRHNIVQGEYRVSGEANEVITTLLGSCVAACIHDPVARVGGMNHFLLPGEASGAERYDVHLMELLINGLLKLGASRDKLQAKLFGGAQMMRGLSDIGSSNARFAREFLGREGIALTGTSLGGEIGRRVQFWPATGRARQMLMAKGEDVAAVIATVPAQASAGGDLELF